MHRLHHANFCRHMITRCAILLCNMLEFGPKDYLGIPQTPRSFGELREMR